MIEVLGQRIARLALWLCGWQTVYTEVIRAMVAAGVTVTATWPDAGGGDEDDDDGGIAESPEWPGPYRGFTGGST